jgi:DNA-binding transcriptional MerR regulator
VQISEAAVRLGTTPRMLRYREALGLLTPRRSGGARRVFGARELLAARHVIDLEERYGVPPGALAFAVRALTEPEVTADVRTLVAASPIEALDFEAAKARQLLRLRQS